MSDEISKNKGLKKGDVNSEGKRFWAYRRRGRKSDGDVYEIWIDEEKYQKRKADQAEWRSSSYADKDGIKRINPDTGDYFRLGDDRPKSEKQDGKKFSAYRAKRYKDKNGYRLENWYDESQFENLRQSNRASGRRGAEKRKQQYQQGTLTKRINADTGKEFVKGDTRPKSDLQDGKKFWGYVASTRTADNFLYERWFDEQEWHYRHVYTAFQRLKLRAKEAGWSFDISVEYLLSIYPNDHLCPILGLKLTWGGKNKDLHPSVDKFIPDEGYTIGNVNWICSRANRMKYDASLEEVTALARWMKNKNAPKGD